jgi:dTDP-4-dehydrorhamnose 3,5-epimerase
VDVRPLAIADVKLITPKRIRDERGFFSETYSARVLAEAGINARLVQDNHSMSLQRGVVRGLHFQAPPHAQDKLVRVTRGSAFDVAVDIRTGSPTYGKHVSAILSAENWTQIWVPRGFAHGFCTLEPHTEVVYKVSEYFAPESDRGLRWDDPALGIEWPVAAGEAILSAKDAQHPLLRDLLGYFR